VTCGRLFFRIIRGPTPTLDDFKSHKARGKPLLDESQRRLWERGISVYDSLDAARRTAQRYQRLGSHIVVLRVESDPGIEVEQTGPMHRFTLYADAQTLLAIVEGAVIPVREETRDDAV